MKCFAPQWRESFLTWFLILLLALPLPSCAVRPPDGGGAAPAGMSRVASPDVGSSAVSGTVAGARRLPVSPASDIPSGLEKSRTGPFPSLAENMFNAAASLVGLPGIAPRMDEGMGFHQDGSVRRAGRENSFDGRRAHSYMSAGLNGVAVSPLYAGMARPWPGDDYSGRRKADGFSAFDNINPVDLALDRGLNYGMGLLNSAGEAALSGLADNGRARLNFRIDRDGYFSGEGDVLLPFWDSPGHTLFAQLGARSMEVSGGRDDGSQRWIGNFGLGHRWFPLAKDMDDAGNLMLGWNVFFDNDFTRSHQRGGAGLEAQYDWIQLAANYYMPLSGWKNSYDFDGSLVEERPARGWDARLKAYLPFYRNVALTGSYTQWYGDNVAMFGSSDELEKDPRVWSYGVEYTPIPLLSAFVKQRSTERDRTDTEFGLQFTYRFGMPWEEQTSHARVAELRTVGGSRHEFVDRENNIILEYRAKSGRYRIEYLGPVGSNSFAFRLVNGLGRPVSGVSGTASLDGAHHASSGSPVGSFVTDGNGGFVLDLIDVEKSPVDAFIQAGESSGHFLLDTTLNDGSLTLIVSGAGGDFLGTGFQTITLTAVLTLGGEDIRIGDGDVIWEVSDSSISGLAAWTRGSRHYNGLTWGAAPLSLSRPEGDRTDGPLGTAPSGNTASLTDIVGNRTVTVRAQVSHDGKRYLAVQQVTFGHGPLSVFSTAPKGRMEYSEGKAACSASRLDLPSESQLQAVSGPGSGGRYGAALAAGWPDDGCNLGTYWYWDNAGDQLGWTVGKAVSLTTGNPSWQYENTHSSHESHPVAICVRSGNP